ALHVVHLAAGNADDVEAIRLTKALEQYALASGAIEFVNSNKALLEGLRRSRCGGDLLKKALSGEPLAEDDDAGVDASCLDKVAAYVGSPLPPAGRFVWGHIYRDATGARWAKLHARVAGQPERSYAVRYESAQAEKAAERLFARLFFPAGLGEVRVEPPPGLRGDLWVNGKQQGAFEPVAPELVLPAGDAQIELRAGKRVLARGQGKVAPGETHALTLASVDEPVSAGPVAGQRPSTPPPPPPWPAALPWAAPGVGAVGLLSAGVFGLLYGGARGDLTDQCSAAKRCASTADGDLDQARFYGTASLISLGVGVVGGGTAAALWLMTPKSEHSEASGGLRWGGGVAPTPGGGSLLVTGRF
ncbi:MAG TPA: hypothetical protein VFS00_10060, partial [Polyangiaceae bacterium]|nr:hypothetical protein [Polyangiaceae bacterium]